MWFDAHADFDTPDDNLSGFTDAMGLAILTGSGWRALRETIPGFRALAEGRVLLAGCATSSLTSERGCATSRLRTAPARSTATCSATTSTTCGARSSASTCTSTSTRSTRARPAPTCPPRRAAPEPGRAADGDRGGLRPLRMAAAAITAYDPAVDPRAAAAAREVAATIAGRARGQRGG